MKSNQLLPRQEYLSYFTAQKAPRYRAIMRYLYANYKNYLVWVDKEMILQHLLLLNHCSDYTMEELDRDLTTLRIDGSVVDRPDTSIVERPEDFRQKQLYRISDNCIVMEEAVIQVERFERQGRTLAGLLDPTLVSSFIQAVRELHKVNLEEEYESLLKAWNTLFDYLKQLNANTQAYANHIRSEEFESISKHEEFLHLKERFLDYVNKFINSLQSSELAIPADIERLDEFIPMIVDRLGQHQVAYQFGSEFDVKEYIDDALEQWANLKRWFIRDNDRESEIRRLMNLTTSTMAKVIQHAAMLSTYQNIAKNRTTDFSHVAGWFAQLSSVDECHRLSTVLFGAAEVRHYWSEQAFDPGDSIWLAEVPVVHLSDARRPRSERNVTTVESRAEEQRQEEAAMAEAAEKQLAFMKAILGKKYIKLSEINQGGELPSFARDYLIEWMGDCLNTDCAYVNGVFTDKALAYTSFGQKIQMISIGTEMVSIRFEDGILQCGDWAISVVEEDDRG